MQILGAMAGLGLVATFVLGGLYLDEREARAVERTELQASIAGLQKSLEASQSARDTEQSAASEVIAQLEARNAEMVQSALLAEERSKQLVIAVGNLWDEKQDLAAALDFADAELLRLVCESYALAGYPTGGACRIAPLSVETDAL